MEDAQDPMEIDKKSEDRPSTPKNKGSRRNSVATPSQSEDIVAEPGDVFWVKLAGYPEWPGRVAKNEEGSSAVMKLKHTDKMKLMYFFGTRDYSWVKDQQLTPFTLDSAEVSKAQKKKTKTLQLAVKEAVQWSKLEPEDRVFPTAEKEPEPKEEESKTEKGTPKKKSPAKKKEKSEEKRTFTTTFLPRPRKDLSNLSEEEKKRKEKRRSWRVKIMRRLALYPPAYDSDDDKEWKDKMRAIKQAQKKGEKGSKSKKEESESKGKKKESKEGKKKEKEKSEKEGGKKRKRSESSADKKEKKPKKQKRDESDKKEKKDKKHKKDKKDKKEKDKKDKKDKKRQKGKES
eukprot:TRINITY_DN2958_c0_g1_i1.p1 TRINITY_DN2958_c0_g1~~TRINITY_DN2958_c0_g1_i1.p1  ORF type:complete len:344 (-),score=133.57 TRINITY_DN2958_c0_g1_i1:958-1989(-)